MVIITPWQTCVYYQFSICFASRLWMVCVNWVWGFDSYLPSWLKRMFCIEHFGIHNDFIRIFIRIRGATLAARGFKDSRCLFKEAFTFRYILSHNSMTCIRNNSLAQSYYSSPLAEYFHLIRFNVSKKIPPHMTTILVLSLAVTATPLMIWMCYLQMSCSDLAHMIGYLNSSPSHCHWAACPIVQLYFLHIYTYSHQPYSAQRAHDAVTT